MSIDLAAAVGYVQRELEAMGNPVKAAGMQAYMKTDMPFYGVQKPGRTQILRHLRNEYRPADREEYEAMILALWRLPHREEKYLAQGVATSFEDFMVPDSLPLYQRLLVKGAW